MQIWDLEYEQTMQFIAIEKWALSGKYYALETIAEKVAPDLLEDIQMFKERRWAPESNSSSD